MTKINQAILLAALEGLQYRLDVFQKQIDTIAAECRSDSKTPPTKKAKAKRVWTAEQKAAASRRMKNHWKKGAFKKKR